MLNKPDMRTPSQHGYITFALANRSILAFGFLMALGSSFGQTFFIGIFSPNIEAEFNLSHSEWGAIYMAGTLMSAATLTYTGRWIDHTPLRAYATIVCGFLVIACLAAAFTPTAWFLIFTIYCLRQAGQGLASHTAVTGMIKYFRYNRGKAVALATLGFPAGRALLPIAAIASITMLGWRETYVACAVVVLLILLPAVIFLLNGVAEQEYTPEESSKSENNKSTIRPRAVNHSLSDVLRDPGFYFFLPAILAPSFFDTALSFHLLSVASLKTWSAEWVTSGYAIYAVATIAASMWMGALVDRLGALRLFILSLIPYIIGTLLLGFMQHAAGAWIFLALYGMGSGIKATLIPVLLSEIYGTRYIGTIRSFVATLSVFGSALGPPALGLALDLDVSVTTMTLAATTYFIASSLLMIIGKRYW